MFDRNVDAASARVSQHRIDGGLERIRGLVPCEGCEAAGRENDARCTERGRRFERPVQAIALRAPSLWIAELERPESNEVDDAEPSPDDLRDELRSSFPPERFELRHRNAHVGDAVSFPERNIVRQRKVE